MSDNDYERRSRPIKHNQEATNQTAQFWSRACTFLVPNRAVFYSVYVYQKNVPKKAWHTSKKRASFWY